MNLSDSYNNAANLTAGINSLTAPPPKGPDMKDYVRVSASANIISVHALCDIPREAAIIAKEISIIWQEDGSHIPIWDEKFKQRGNPWELPNRIAQTEKEYFISKFKDGHTNGSILCASIWINNTNKQHCYRCITGRKYL